MYKKEVWVYFDASVQKCLASSSWIDSKIICKTRILYDGLLTSAKPLIPAVSSWHRGRSVMFWDVGVLCSKGEFWNTSPGKKGETAELLLVKPRVQTRSLEETCAKCLCTKRCHRGRLNFISLYKKGLVYSKLASTSRKRNASDAIKAQQYP